MEHTVYSQFMAQLDFYNIIVQVTYVKLNYLIW